MMNLSPSLHLNRRALTLVEMLVGMAITLVMMAAVVNLFANISQGVRNRRATMEVSGDLRIARARLYNDLEGATCLRFPKNTHGVMPKPDSNNMPDGYFEIVEGRWSDDNSGGTFDRATSLIPSSNLLYNSQGEPLDPNEVTDGGALGDYDDILAMTVESQTERFRGRGRGLRPGGDPSNIGTPPNFTDGDWVDMAISSPVAEVIWFATQNPLDRSEGEPGMRKIYRRVILVAPWYGTETKEIGGTPTSGSDPLLDLNKPQFTGGTPAETRRLQLEELRRFQETYDISVRLEDGRLVPNSLADLARREHRFAHAPLSSSAPPNIEYYPHQFPYNLYDSHFFAGADEEELSTAPFVSSSLRRLRGERAGEDLVLDNALAFDVQVFDPGAPLIDVDGTIVQPTGTPTSAFITAINSNTGVITGYGAYADLGWNDGGQYVPLATAPAHLFQQERRLGWHPAFPTYVTGTPNGIPCVYDTWTTHYETDQSNQEEAPFYTFANSTVPWEPWQIGVTDQGANGLDENGINGPDDPLERETSPPYPYPLYGVQVKIRLYEPDSRQIRETTVTRNLAK
jgi:type II secretory pathway pseudopilin PulG